MQGFLPRSVKYMRAFAEAYSTEFLITQAPLAQIQGKVKRAIVQQSAAQLNWSHDLVLIDRLKKIEDTLRKKSNRDWLQSLKF